MSEECEKKEKKPRPAPPPPPPALATAALLIRGAAAHVLGLRPGPCGGEMQPLWVTEPGHAKITMNLEGSTRSPFPKEDEAHGALIEAIEAATNQLVRVNACVCVIELDRATAKERYGDFVCDPRLAQAETSRFAHIPGTLLVEIPTNWQLCATAGACGPVTFEQKTMEQGSKKKPDTMILLKKRQLMVRYRVANGDASEGADLRDEQPSKEAAAKLCDGAVRIKVPGIDADAPGVPAAGAADRAASAAEAPEEAAAGEGEEDEAVVDPWTVAGKIDYNKLIEKFGSTAITPELMERIERLTVGRGNVPKLHHWLRRGIFFSHRDMNLICSLVEQNKPFYLYTGRGPSSLAMHLGHLIPFMFTKWLQDAFDVPLVIQMTDDEKFLWKGEWDVDKGDNLMHFRHLTNENVKDIIACGFDKKKTFIFSDLDYFGPMYPNICRIWKAITYSQARASFGFVGESNIGKSAFPAVQAAPSFPSTFQIPLKGKDTMACLIPCAIDQDPYFRITRDIAHKLVPAAHPLKGKPALIHSKFFPPLQGSEGKMSASNENSAVYLLDTPEMIDSKIRNYAFSGGRQTAKEQREKGADLEADVSYQWLRFFLEDDGELARIAEEYGTGTGEFWSTGSVKERLIKLLQGLVKEHQERRAKVTDEEVAEWMAVRGLEF